MIGHYIYKACDALLPVLDNMIAIAALKTATQPDTIIYALPEDMLTEGAHAVVADLAREAPHCLQLPHDRIVIETTVDGGKTALAVYISKVAAPSLMIFFRDDAGWACAPFFSVFGIEDGFLTASRTDIRDGRPFEGANIESEREFSPLVALLAALSCRNVTVAAVDQSRLNAARARRGKRPFARYHVLTIKESVSVRSSPRGGTHASPAMHVRRGHYFNHLRATAFSRANPPRRTYPARNTRG